MIKKQQQILDTQIIEQGKGETKMVEKKHPRPTVDQLIGQIANKYFLMNFLRQHNIADVEQLQVVDHYVQGKHRAGIIVAVKECNRSEKTKVLIDLKLGEPAIEQVHDALYTTGKDCDIKIIIYSDGHNIEDAGIPSADEYVVLGLVSRLQEDNVPIILFKINEATSALSYNDLQQKWESVDRTNTFSIPPRESFWAETFWAIYFDSFNECFGYQKTPFDSGFRDTSEWGYLIYIDCQMEGEMAIYWDEQGVNYKIKQSDDSQEYLKRTMDVKMEDFKKRYGQNNVQFENVVGRLPRLYIKYSDKPFSWIYTATPTEITQFAKTMFEDVCELRWQIDEVVEHLYQN